MESKMYQVKINRKRSGDTVAIITTRGEDGTLVRTSSVVNSTKDIAALVESHQAGVKAYDPAEHKRAHDLASKAAETPWDE